MPDYTENQMVKKGWVKFEEVGSWFKVIDGTLCQAPMLVDGGGDLDDRESGCEVVLMEEQWELDLINQRLGTNYKMDDFFGR